jgi:DNA replication factor GINS
LYNELYKAWKSEITSEETQPLSDDFYQRAEAYLGGAEQESSTDEHTTKGRLLLREKEIANRLLRELKDVRLRKLLALAQHGEAINDANLTAEERKLAKDFAKSLQAFNRGVPEPKPPPSAETVELSVLRFLEDIPEIVGTDLRIYGPYKKEDVGSLPNQNATALVKQGAAKEIEVRRITNPQKNKLNTAINNK